MQKLPDKMNAIAIKNWTDYEVGQKVYFVSKYSQVDARLITVSKVGRKWAYFHELRPDNKVGIGTVFLIEGAFGKVGTLYESEEAYQSQLEQQKLYDRLAKVDWRSLTPEQARAVHAIVFGEVVV